jgi:NTE family protein
MDEFKEIFENFVCEGGGVKGVAIPGALITLHKARILKNLKRYAGSSIGALFCALLAMNVSVDKIIYLTISMDFTKMQTKSWIPVQVARLVCNYGLAKNKRITDIIREAFEFVGEDPDTTFRQNYNKTGKELYISGTNLNTNMVCFFSHHNYPNMPITQAISISMCVPTYYVPFKFEGDYWVDGGTAENYPIYIFNDLEKLVSGNVYDISRDPINPKTIGIKLLTKGEEHTKRLWTGRQETKNLRGFVNSLIDTMSRQIEMGDISDSYLRQTIPIPNIDTSFFDLDLSKNKRKELMKRGEEAATHYFECYCENKINLCDNQRLDTLLVQVPPLTHELHSRRLKQDNEMVNVVAGTTKI